MNPRTANDTIKLTQVGRAKQLRHSTTEFQSEFGGNHTFETLVSKMSGVRIFFDGIYIGNSSCEYFKYVSVNILNTLNGDVSLRR